MKKMFCIIGLTGAGKSTYLNHILDDKDKYGLSDLNRLVYYTTRAPRIGEKDGVDYYFVKEGDKPASLVNYTHPDRAGVRLIFNPELIEERTYKTMNNGYATYYTTVDCVKEDYYLCTPSIEQLVKYIDYFGSDKIAVIEIYADMRIRIERSLNRIRTDNDGYEICRRIIAEKEDWERANYLGMLENGTIRNFLKINNTIAFNFTDNMKSIVEFIKEKY